MKNIYKFTKNFVESIKKLWYDLVARSFRGVTMNNKKNTGILDAKVLANYIKEYYRKRINKQEISPIKLQKSLYFCFAYWGGFVRRQNFGNNELNRDYSEYLFTNKIQAWVYGPVVPEVYHCQNLDDYYEKNPFKDNFIQDFINGILDDVLNSNDFKLVEVSHQDKCWKRNFKPNSKFHNGEIPFEEIIEEYARNY